MSLCIGGSGVRAACDALALVTPYDLKWSGMLKLHGQGYFLQGCPVFIREEWVEYCLGLITNVSQPEAVFLRTIAVLLADSEHNVSQLVGFMTERTLCAEHGRAHRRPLRKLMTSRLLEIATNAK